MHYLDYAATTPVKPEVASLIYETMLETFGNPSSTYKIGKSAKLLMNEARHHIAQLLEVKAASIYFTSGATEANNWAIWSQATSAKQLTQRTHLVCLDVEHPSVKTVVEALIHDGFSVTFIRPEPDWTTEQFLEAFKKIGRASCRERV